MNNCHSNVEVSTNMTTFNGTTPRTQTRRRKMEKVGNNQGKGRLQKEQKDQGMKRQHQHIPQKMKLN
jgi:hypothetical protein